MKQKIIFHDPFTLDSYDKKKKKKQREYTLEEKGRHPNVICRRTHPFHHTFKTCNSSVIH